MTKYSAITRWPVVHLDGPPREPAAGFSRVMRSGQAARRIIGAHRIYDQVSTSRTIGDIHRAAARTRQRETRDVMFESTGVGWVVQPREHRRWVHVVAVHDRREHVEAKASRFEQRARVHRQTHVSDEPRPDRGVVDHDPVLTK